MLTQKILRCRLKSKLFTSLTTFSFHCQNECVFAFELVHNVLKFKVAAGYYIAWFFSPKILLVFSILLAVFDLQYLHLCTVLLEPKISIHSTSTKYCRQHLYAHNFWLIFFSLFFGKWKNYNKLLWLNENTYKNQLINKKNNVYKIKKWVTQIFVYFSNICCFSNKILFQKCEQALITIVLF